jgi:hypothetical protein
VDALHRSLPGDSISYGISSKQPCCHHEIQLSIGEYVGISRNVEMEPALPVDMGTSTALESGPAFRTSQDDRSTLSSQFGLIAGVGAAVHIGKLRVAPTVRYTRWEKDANFPNFLTKADQVEFLTSVALGTPSDPAHLTGHWLSLGVMGGYL